MKKILFLLFITLASPMARAEKLIIGDPLLGEVSNDFFREFLPPPEGPEGRYDFDYIADNEQLVVFEALAELKRLAFSEFTFLKSSLRRAAEKADEGGKALIATEIRAQLIHIPRVRHPLGPEIEVINRNWILAKRVELLKSAKSELDLNKKSALEDSARLMERASLFYVRLGHTKGEICWAQNLFCRLQSGTPCWTECEIIATKRIGDGTCARHGDYLLAWFPALGKVVDQWSAEKAAQLGGKNDLDAAACTVWLEEMRPTFVAECGEAWVTDLYADRGKRTMVWLLAVRSLRCSSLKYWGNETSLSGGSWDTQLSKNRERLSENLVALKAHLQALSVQCCGSVSVDNPGLASPVNPVPDPIPNRVPQEIIPSAGCTSCQQGSKYYLPSYSNIGH